MVFLPDVMQSVSLSSLLPFLLLTLPVSSVSSSPDWLSLNQTVGGRLHVGVPFSQPCFSYKSGGVQNIPNSEECSEIQAHNEDHRKSRHYSVLLLVLF